LGKYLRKPYDELRMQTVALDITFDDSARQDGAAEASVIVLCAAELAECTCPDWCERDHDRD
jgi:hypothetical protein